MTQFGTINVRVELEGENARKFEVIKKNLGLKQNTEVIRSLIRDAYLRIQPAGAGGGAEALEACRI